MATTATSGTNTARTPRQKDDDEMKRYDYLHRSFPSPPKSPYSVVSRSALTYSATDRLMELARPKQRKDNLLREGILRLIFYRGYCSFLFFIFEFQSFQKIITIRHIVVF
jgi:hypothetical protein